jgi:hypothetical protein
MAEAQVLPPRQGEQQQGGGGGVSHRKANFTSLQYPNFDSHAGHQL